MFRSTFHFKEIDADPISSARCRRAESRKSARTTADTGATAIQRNRTADDFGDKFLKRKGTVDPDLDLEL